MFSSVATDFGSWTICLSTLTEDIKIDLYLSPERKDRTGDNHGGVLIYVNESNFHYTKLLTIQHISLKTLRH